MTITLSTCSAFIIDTAVAAPNYILKLPGHIVVTVASSIAALSIQKVAFIALAIFVIAYGAYRLYKFIYPTIAYSKASENLKQAYSNVVDSWCETHKAAVKVLEFTNPVINKPAAQNAIKVYLLTIPEAVAAVKSYTIVLQNLKTAMISLSLTTPNRREMSSTIDNFQQLASDLLKAIAAHQALSTSIANSIIKARSDNPAISEGDINTLILAKIVEGKVELESAIDQVQIRP